VSFGAAAATAAAATILNDASAAASEPQMSSRSVTDSKPATGVGSWSSDTGEGSW
jgi:hypothetical protein